ncbi:GTPase RhebL1-like [Pyxicephalus adspersus]|uniref:GTPase RhebL1-like n=1 Tax=Pyxicephalus adspersus TaxID=30357 RepID=UPI003B597CC7
MSSAKSRTIVVLGLRGVGKTSLILQFIKGEPTRDYHPSKDKCKCHSTPEKYHLSIDNFKYYLNICWTKTFSMDQTKYKLCVVDTTSQAEFSFIPPSYVSGVDGYIIVYSVDSPRSFHIASVLYKMLKDKRGKGCMPVVLVGNKKDIPPVR